MKLKKINKKGAMELSMSTVVILVLAMSMLILGLVLIRTIFTGAKYNVDQINNKVQDEINKLFVEDKKIVVYLANNKADIKQGESWGIAFGVKNLIQGVSESAKFSYEVTMAESGCNIKEKEALSWIKLGQGSSINLAPGQTKVWLVRFEVPDGSPLCMVRYNVDIKSDGQFYTAESFDINVVA